jgi:hypothetical protein
MPANTAKGYPYPVGTDRVMDGDDAIKNLAEAVTTRAGTLAAGVLTVPVSANGTNYQVAVTFPVGRFANPPRVTCSTVGTAPANTGCCVYQNQLPTATGCTITGVRTTGAGTPFDVHWIAVDAA